VHWALDEEARFATLEDIAVSPDARSTGIGARMFDMIEQEATRRHAKWLFLESGLQNHRAHAFFEHHGFRTVSKVMAKKFNA
jgi:N-acetylglutamate synthase-like GNAT family acetyltransferase